MVEFRWIIMSLFLMLVFRFPAATGQQSFIIRVEDEVTLSCKNVIDDKGKCDSTTWIFTDSRTKQTVLLFEHGQIHNDAKAKSDRRVTEKCSLVIKKVTVEDVGLYTCRQFRSGQQQGEDSAVHLSVINMTEHQDADKVTLNCSVLIYEHCRHTVEWLYEGNKNDLTDMKRSQHSCSATVTFTTSDFNQKSKHPELFKCNVTDSYTKKVQLFPFSPQSSDGDATTTRSILTAAQTTTTMVTTTKQEGDGATTTESPKTITSTWETRNTWTSVKKITSAGTNNNDQTKQKGLSQVQLTFIIVSVGLAALMIIAVVVIRWKRTKGNKTHMNGNMADPEDGVSYASISYTGKTNSKGRVRGDDEDDAVTYMKVKASSSSAGASADPSSLYATIN